MQNNANEYRILHDDPKGAPTQPDKRRLGALGHLKHLFELADHVISLVATQSHHEHLSKQFG